MSTPKPPCPRCKGDGIDPIMLEDSFEPTYWELVNNDPRTCSQCSGFGVEDPFLDNEWD